VTSNYLPVCPTCSCRGNSACQNRWHEQAGLSMTGQYDKSEAAALAAELWECPKCSRTDPRAGSMWGCFLCYRRACGARTVSP
jgi:hypothetical protein